MSRCLGLQFKYQANASVDDLLNIYPGRFKDFFPHNKMVRLHAATLTFYSDGPMVLKFPN